MSNNSKNFFEASFRRRVLSEEEEKRRTRRGPEVSQRSLPTSLPFKQALQRAAGWLAGCAALLNLALPSLGGNPTPSTEGPDRPGDEGGRGGAGARWDAECISNPSVSVSSLSGDIITIAMAAPLGEPGREGEAVGAPGLLVLPRSPFWFGVKLLY